MDEHPQSSLDHDSHDVEGPAAPLTDSPWFWAYVFACGGLIALLLMGPKYVARQNQIERKTERRLQVSRSRSEPSAGTKQVSLVDESRDQSSSAHAASDRPGISLTPLYITMLLILSVVFFRFRSRPF